MSYDIIVRFPNKEIADEWCGQMSDGFGEGYCSFSFWRKKEGTRGSCIEHFERVVGYAPPGTPVYFMGRLFDDQA